MKNLKLACSTVLYHDLDVFRAIDLIADDGFGFVEIVDVPGFCPHLEFTGPQPLFVRNLENVLSKRCLSITSIYITPGSFFSPEIDQTFSRMRNGFLLARELGVARITLVPGPHVQESVWEATAHKLAENLRSAADEAEKHGIEILVEAPHLNTFTETLGETVRFLRLLSDERVKYAFDTSHVFRDQETSPLKGMNMIGANFVRNIHLRDAKGQNISVTPGKGCIDFESFLRELQRSNYSGGTTLELEYSNYSLSERREELRYAKQYIEALWYHRPLTFKAKMRASPKVEFTRRLFKNPKRELRRYKFLVDIYHRLWAAFAALRPVRVYEGVWKNKWDSFRRRKIVIQNANSIPLSITPKKPIKVAILGCGYAGNMHAAGFQRLAGVTVAGAADIDANKAQTLGNKYNCPAFASLGDMISMVEPNIVSVCTREWLHYEPIMQLLRQDIDVFSEKILATSFQNAKEMVELAKSRNRVLGINYNYRFMPGIQKLKEIIQDRYFGKLELLNIKVHAFSYHHALDIVSFLGGDIVKVKASYQNDDALRPFGGMDWSLFDPDILYVPSKNLAAIFELGNKATCVIASSYLHDPFGLILSVDALFEKGDVTLTGIRMADVVGKLSWNSRTDLHGVNLNHRHGLFARGYEYCFYKSIESFMNAYLKGEDPGTPGKQGLFNILLENAIYQSNLTGAAITMRDDLEKITSSILDKTHQD